MECPESGGTHRFRVRKMGTKRARTQECKAIPRCGVGHEMPQLSELQVPKETTKTPQESQAIDTGNRNELNTDDVLTGRLEVGRHRWVVLEHHDVFSVVPIRTCVRVLVGRNTIRARQ